MKKMKKLKMRTQNGGSSSIVGVRVEGRRVSEMKRRLSVILSIGIFIMCMGGFNLNANSAIDSLTGNGTDGEPYVISSEEHFSLIGTGDYTLDKVYKIIANLDFSGGNAQYFKSLGASTSGLGFKGKLLGDLGGGARPTVNLSITVSDQGHGFVRYLEGGTISNFILTGTIAHNNSTTSAAAQLGAVAGVASAGTTLNRTTISNIDSYVNITSTSISNTAQIGGIVGNIAGSAVATIDNCRNFQDLNPNPNTALSSVGGIVGYASNTKSIISNCENRGNITARNYIGGIAGYGGTGATTVGLSILNCANLGNITGNDKGSATIGGIFASGTVEIEQCFNTGTITGNNNVGGIAGNCATTGDALISIKNCYNTGEINSPSAGANKVGSGIVHNISSKGNVVLSNNYSIAAHSSVTSYYAIQYNAALAATPTGTLTVSSNYYFNPSGTVIDPTAGSVPTPLSADEMKLSASFVGFDFDDITTDGTDNIWKLMPLTAEENIYGYQYPQLVSNMHREPVSMNTPLTNFSTEWEANLGAEKYTVRWGKNPFADRYLVTVKDKENHTIVDSVAVSKTDAKYEFTLGDNNYKADEVYSLFVTAVSDQNGSTPEASYAVDTCFAGGTGELQDRYQIGNLRHFKNINNKPDGNFLQIDDIGAVTGADMITAFAGNYNGNNKIITASITSEAVNVAPFATVTGTSKTIENVRVDGAVTGYDTGVVIDNNSKLQSIGGIIGAGVSTGSVTIKNCINNAVVTFETARTGNTFAGGIIGHANAAIASITGCENIKNVSHNGGGAPHVGGISGRGRAIMDCINRGDITGSGANVGGIIGYLEASYVRESANLGRVNGVTDVGGIAGTAVSNAATTISECFNSGPVNGTTRPAGILGRALGSVTVSDCFNTAIVTGTTSPGSLIGHLTCGNTTTTTISNCYDLQNTTMQVIGAVGTGGTFTPSKLFMINANSNFPNEFNGSPTAITLTALQTLLTDDTSFTADKWTKDETPGAYPYPQLTKQGYEKLYYKIDIIVAEGGGINKDNVIYVKYNETVTIDIDPNFGYYISDVKFNNVSIDASEITPDGFQYESAQITEDSVIEIFFTKYAKPSITESGIFSDPLPLTELSARVESETLDGKSAGGMLYSKFESASCFEILDYGMVFSEVNQNPENGGSDCALISAFDGGRTVDAFVMLLLGKNSDATALSKTYYLKPYVVYRDAGTSDEGEYAYGTVQSVSLQAFDISE